MKSVDKYKLLTEGNIKTTIGRLALPCIISMLITSLYNMADSYFVSSLGTGAIGACAVVFSLMAIIQAFGFFFGHGSGNYISRQLGQKKYDDAANMAATGYFTSMAFGLFITIFGLIFIEPFAILLGSDEVILPFAKTYMIYILIGAPFMTSSLTMNNQLRFQGNAFFAMIGMATGAILNIFGDFILVPIFGMNGAGLSTLISQIISFILLRIGIIKSSNININIKNYRFSGNLYLNIIKGGAPSLLRQSIGSIATICLNHVCLKYGPDAVAAMGVVTRITAIPCSVATGIGQGFQPVCGYNYGAKKYDRVKEGYLFTLLVSAIVLVTLCSLSFVFAKELIDLFCEDPTKIIDYELFTSFGVTTLRLHICFIPLIGLTMPGHMMLQTMGKAVRASILAIARQGIFFIPLLYILGNSVEGLQWTQPVCDILTTVITFIILIDVFRKDLKEI